MSVGVNLLPAEVVFARRRRRRIGRWVAAIIVLSGAACVPLGYDALQTARAASLDGRVEPIEARLEMVRADLSEAMQRHENLATQIARADALRSKRPWAALLGHLAQGLPETVWLTGIETRIGVSASQVSGSPSPKGGAPGPVVLDGPVGLVLEGFALDHESLYEYMARLKSAGLFNEVKLTSAGKMSSADGNAVRFALSCAW